MTKNPQLRRMLVALGISGALNIALLVSGAFLESAKQPHPRIERIVDAWGWPGEAFATSLVPRGHDIAHVGGVVLVGFTLLVFFYATLVWIAISLSAWLHSWLVTKQRT